MNQTVSFGLLFGGGILLTSALTSSSVGDVVKGHAGNVKDTGARFAGSSPTGTVGQIGSAIAAGARSAGYVNPFAGAKLTPERIDQGVDYAGTGTIAAIGDAVITTVFPHGSSGSGWPGGGYVEYQLTSGPDAGAYIYAAEGVSPTVKAGQKVSAGDVIAHIVPGSSTGIETGLASGSGTSSWASGHGGYTEGQLTGAGQWFSDLLAELGAPAGLVEGRKPTGETPTFQVGPVL